MMMLVLLRRTSGGFMGDKPRIVFADTYYPGFIQTFREQFGIFSYEEWLDAILKESFGTADFYSKAFRKQGWEAFDIIANFPQLQKLWSAERGQNQEDLKMILRDQILYYKPDVVFLQDLSFCNTEMLLDFKRDAVLAGQCSCPPPPESNVRLFHTLFTSFPHYVDWFNSLGVKGHYNPLAFEPSVLENVREWGTVNYRTSDIAFVGGVGTPSHWTYGMEVLEAIAKEFEQSDFYGYGYELLPETSFVKKRFRREAWGLAMYRKLLESKIVINRHGEVSRNYANNMKMYETTGCGALLLTDMKDNLNSLFEIEGANQEIVAYTSAKGAVEKIHQLLEDEPMRARIAKAGQQRTLKDHTYDARMKLVSDTLKGML
jgi:hypothetical protein